MLVPLGTATALMLVMVAKHFCADFLFQTAWIARGKSSPEGWLLPLAIHAGGHALITLVVTLIVCPALWWIAPVEWLVHGLIDRGKVVVGKQCRLDIAKTEFWWLFGFDQFLHQVTNVAIIFALLAYGQARG